MRTNKFGMKYASVLIGAFALASLAQAGEREGHGGIGKVCRDPKTNKISKKVRLLDLIEAEYADELSPNLPPLSQTQFIQTINAKLRLAIAQAQFDASYVHVQENRHGKPMGFGLPDPSDYHPRVAIKEKNCRWEVIGLYDDDADVLNYDPEIYAKMDRIDQDAFVTHEAIYRVARTHGAKDSDISRRLVGMLFSENGDSKKLDELITAPRTFGTRVQCFDHDISLTAPGGNPPDLGSNQKGYEMTFSKDNTNGFTSVECHGTIDKLPTCKIEVYAYGMGGAWIQGNLSPFPDGDLHYGNTQSLWCGLR